jgi:uncharacterized RDD family membrane protein YckC
MFCNKCGNEIADNLKFCNKCGNEIKKESSNNAEKIIKESDNLAGFWVRAGAFIIDFVISYFGAWLLLGLFIGIMNSGSDFFDKISDEAAGLLSFGVVIIYHIALLSKWGTTIGKKLFGLKVVDSETNNKITINKAIIRSFSYILSSIVFGAGFLVIAFDKKKRQGWHDIIAKTRVVEEKDKKLTLAIIISIFAILGLLYISSDSFLSNDQESILPTVANIYCPLSSEKMNLKSNGYGGSGTIIDPEGLILTNSHVIPQEGEYLNINKEGCFVIINNQETQEPEVYLANPIVIPELSDTYDIAYLKIYNVYIDEEYKKWGEFPKTFPSFDASSACADEAVKLGEQIRVYGYPISTGGASLTVTEGIVSSLPGDGLILTSAKIDQGNSGGVAVDSNGCMIGIPSAVSKGEYENMGVIISTSLIREFEDKYNNYKSKSGNGETTAQNSLDLSAFENESEIKSGYLNSDLGENPKYLYSLDFNPNGASLFGVTFGDTLENIKIEDIDSADESSGWVHLKNGASYRLTKDKKVAEFALHEPIISKLGILRREEIEFKFGKPDKVEEDVLPKGGRTYDYYFYGKGLIVRWWGEGIQLINIIEK